MRLPSFDSDASAGPGGLVVEPAGAAAVAVPGGAATLKADYLRAGDDLVVEARDGDVTLIKGFFATEAAPDIVVGGALVQGSLASRLARGSDLLAESGLQGQDGGDLLIGGNEADLLGSVLGTDGLQEAALPREAAGSEPVAEVTETVGQVVIQRADGSTLVAEPGTPLYQDDLVTTDQDGSVGISFVDGMSFSLGAEARMLLDEFRYDPAENEGGGLLSVLQGQFTFVSGQAAHTAEDALMIETPTMTIGVRGTKVVAQAGAEGETSRIALLAEEDGTVGKIMVTTDQGGELISEANMMVEVVSRFQPPSPQVRLSSDQVHDYFTSALSVLPAPAEFLHPEAPAPAGGHGEVAHPSPAAAQAPSSAPVAQPADASAGLEIAPAAASFAPEAVVDEREPEPAPEAAAIPEAVADKVPVHRVVSSSERIEASLGAMPVARDDVEAPPGQAAPVLAERPSAVGDALQAGPRTLDLPSTAGAASTAGAPSTPVNTAPTVDTPIADQATPEDAAFSLDVSGAFSDDGALTYSATLTGGGALPAWLSIDPASGILSGTPANGDVGILDVAVTATDGGGLSADSTFQLTIANTNDAPTVTAALVDAQPTQGVAFAYDAGSAFGDLDLVHGDSLSFSAKLAGGAALPGWLSIDPASGLLSGTPGLGDVGTTWSIVVTARDGSDASVSDSFDVTVDNVNDAPVLNVAGAPTLTAIAEDSAAPAGDTVAQIVIDGSISDADGPVAEAIAVTLVDDANGSWEYSTDGGATFNAIAPVSSNSALLLDAAAKIRFVPDADYNGTATFAYKAWDQSSGASGDSGVDTSVGTAFSTALEIASITVNAVNDAPLLDPAGAPALTAIVEDADDPAGNTVAEIVVDGSITDIDGPVAEAIAVTSVDGSNGAWEYSIDGGATFNAIGAVSNSGALLLDGTAKIRFVSDADYNGSATFSYKAWDQSSGASGDSGVDTTGNLAFSAASEVASITIDPANDAPLLDVSGDPTLTAIPRGSTEPAGNTVAEIVIDGSITDVDGPAPESIAVTAVDDTNGSWEYSTDGGATFNAIGAVTETSALLLDAAAKVRFVPDAAYDGTASFSYKAWDHGTGAVGDSGVDTTSGTAFSTAIETASINVTPAPSGTAPTVAGASALDFGGTNSYVDVGDPGASADDLDLGTGDLTVEAWFFWDGAGTGDQMIASKYNQTGSKEGYSISLSDSELVVRVNVNGGSADVDTAASSIAMVGSPGWYHVAMVIDQEAGDGGSTITGYLNGSSAGWTAGHGSVTDDTFTRDGAGTDTNKSFMIGAVDNGPNQTMYFDSQIADVRVWDSARSQTEIADNMARTLNGDESGLVGNWWLDEGAGTTASNSVAGGADGTIGGGPSWESTTVYSLATNGDIDGRITAIDLEGDTLSFSVLGNAGHGSATIDASTGAWEYTPDNGYSGADSFSYQISDGNGGTDSVNISVVVS